MGLFRSEPMCHGTLVIPSDRARDFIELLGLNTSIQFVDMNACLMKRQYQKYVKRIDDMENILRFLYEQIKQLPGTTIIPADVDKFLKSQCNYQFESIEETLHNLHKQFLRFQENNLDLIKQKNLASEERAVLEKAIDSFKLLSNDNQEQNFLRASDAEDVQNSSNFFFTIAGVLANTDQDKFSRAVIRVARGNAITLFSDVNEEILNPTTLKPMSRVVFVIYVLSGSNPKHPNSVVSKIHRIINAFGTNSYEWPKSLNDALQRLEAISEVIKDKATALFAYENYFASEVQALLNVKSPSKGSLIEDYRLFCVKEKAIYSSLNLFEGKEITLRANCWFLVSEETRIRQILTQAKKADQALAFLLTDNIPLTSSLPPTYSKTNELTRPFQVLLDTYGIPRYREINPAIFTVITFPFIYGIMFGDVGHGLIILSFSIYLLRNAHKWQKNRDELASMIVGGRYLILLISLFSIYSGLLYNDFFSLGLNLFGTRYLKKSSDTSVITYKYDSTRNPYPFGFDPIWKGAINELQFTNSFKMKLSVIVGFVHMAAGLFLKGINNIYFKDYIHFFFVLIPQVLFLFCFLGFMNLIIFWKWLTPVGEIDGKTNKPLIITNLVELCLGQKPVLVAFRGQATVQKICLITMGISVPLMLFVVPLTNLYNQKKLKKQLSVLENDVEVDAQDIKESEYDFWEQFIHQLVETIEFVLSSISNTASYLRLWALSLAHQQLSLVLFNMTIKTVLESNMDIVANGIVLFFVFAMFAAATFGVMICIDSMECFLHALRLHWVEFQNKFYYADGYAFQPFILKNILMDSVE